MLAEENENLRRYRIVQNKLAKTNKTILAFLLPEGFSVYAFANSAISVDIGEIVVCYGLGLPLY